MRRRTAVLFPPSAVRRCLDRPPAYTPKIQYPNRIFGFTKANLSMYDTLDFIRSSQEHYRSSTGVTRPNQPSPHPSARLLSDPHPPPPFPEAPEIRRSTPPDYHRARAPVINTTPPRRYGSCSFRDNQDVVVSLDVCSRSI